MPSGITVQLTESIEEDSVRRDYVAVAHCVRSLGVNFSAGEAERRASGKLQAVSSDTTHRSHLQSKRRDSFGDESDPSTHEAWSRGQHGSWDQPSSGVATGVAKSQNWAPKRCVMTLAS